MPIKHAIAQRLPRSIALTVGLLFIPTALILPADAGVLKQGQPANSYYWQLVSTSKGSHWLCRKVSVGKFQKHANCQAAGARKPQ